MSQTKITLAGSVALGTGVMIGAGIFALVGQVAGLAGDWFPLAFLAGALVAGVSSYGYARYSSVNPSAGGIAMLLKDAYGPGVVAGSFSLFMYVSMVSPRACSRAPSAPTCCGPSGSRTRSSWCRCSASRRSRRLPW